MAATVRDLVYMAESIPEGSTWTATGLGKNAWHIAAATICLGGHVRVGFEDNLYLEKGVLAESNGQMVEKVVQLAKLLISAIEHFFTLLKKLTYELVNYEYIIT